MFCLGKLLTLYLCLALHSTLLTFVKEFVVNLPHTLHVHLFVFRKEQVSKQKKTQKRKQTELVKFIYLKNLYQSKCTLILYFMIDNPV